MYGGFRLPSVFSSHVGGCGCFALTKLVLTASVIPPWLWWMLTKCGDGHCHSDLCGVSYVMVKCCDLPAVPNLSVTERVFSFCHEVLLSSRFHVRMVVFQCVTELYNKLFSINPVKYTLCFWALCHGELGFTCKSTFSRVHTNYKLQVVVFCLYKLENLKINFWTSNTFSSLQWKMFIYLFI